MGMISQVEFHYPGTDPVSHIILPEFIMVRGTKYVQENTSCVCYADDYAGYNDEYDEYGALIGQEPTPVQPEAPPAPVFKIGDIVRFTGSAFSHDGPYYSSVGVIVAVKDTTGWFGVCFPSVSDRSLHDLDGAIHSAYGWWCVDTEIAHV